jgi:polyisoprenoid-binding protein YceI
MNQRLTTRILSLIIVALAAACGGAASVDVSASPAPTTAAPTTAAPSPTASGLAWIVSDKSKATVTVREQLAAFNFPTDAVLVATGAKGGFTLNADGTFATGSQISFDASSLTSDESLRDSFVKQSVLGTRQFPTATFVPTKTSGLTVPLAASGHFTFTLSGKLTIHGVTKDVTFDVDATRTAADLTATATLNPTVKFEDFGMPQPASPGRVISVVDVIHVVVSLVATGPAS